MATFIMTKEKILH